MDSDTLFSTFVMSLASSALMELGVIEDPQSKTKRVRREAATQHIAVLEMLQEKTKGNLSSEENKMLGQVITDLKLEFARVGG